MAEAKWEEEDTDSSDTEDLMKAMIDEEMGGGYLLLATKSNKTHTVKSLVRLGVDVDIVVGGFTALHFSSMEGTMSMVECLVNIGADVNVRAKDQRNCLHFASQSNNPDLVQYLVSLGMDVNCKDVNDATPLLISAATGNMDVTRCLIGLGADLNASEKTQQRNCLHFAAQSNNPELAQYLVSQGVDVNSKDVHKVTPLFLSAAEGNMEMTECLVDLGADFNARDINQGTCLHYAALSSNNPELVQYLVNLGMDVNCKEASDFTPLLVAAKKGDMDMVECLIRLGADINWKNKDNMNCLHFASDSNNRDLVQYLASLDVDLNCKNVDDITPLLLSTSRSNVNMVKCLVDLGVDVNARNTRDHWNCLHFASQSTNPEMVHYLVSQGVDVSCRDAYEGTPLHVSSRNGNLDIVKCLIRLNADVNARDKDQKTCLHLASLSGNLDLVEYLVSIGVDVDIRDADDTTPLLYSACTGDLDMTRCLVGLGADINTRNRDQMNCLRAASQTNNPDLAEYLVSLGVDVNCRDTENATPLFLSTACGYMDMTKCLIALGADVNARNKDQRTCLHFAGQSENPDMAKYLVRQGLDVNCKDADDITPLLISASNGYIDTTKCLIGLGADVNARDRDQWNCLHAAAQSTNPHLVKYLIGQGADVKRKNIQGFTPLSMSLLYKDYETASAFIDQYSETLQSYLEYEIAYAIADTMENSSTGTVTFLSSEVLLRNHPLVLCARIDYSDGARLILDAGANISIDTLKQSCLHWSCTYGHTDIVRLMLLTGEEFDLSDQSGQELFKKLPFSSVIDYSDIVTLVQVPQKMTLESLISMPGIGDVLRIPGRYADNVHQAVSEYLVPFPCTAIGELAGVELKLCGSVAEGAKVGLPNEMDILYIFNKIGQKFSSSNVTQMFSGYVEFTELDDTKARGSAYFHETFFDKWFEFFKNHSDTVSISKVEFGETVGVVKKGNRKACTPILLLWHDDLNTICVSVDLVPCVHIDSWSEEFISRTWLMDYSEIREKGYILVPKPPHPKSEIADQFTEKELENLWRISFSHLEVEHIRSLDDKTRNVYVAAKCLRNPDVCHIMISEGKGLPKNVGDYISSYMLKSMFLKNVEDFLNPDHPQSLEEMVCKVYDDLDEALHKGFIPTFFMPTVNVLAGLKLDVGKSAKVARIMRTFVRKFCSGEREVVIGRDITIDTDQQWTYNVFDILTDHWTTKTFNIRSGPRREAEAETQAEMSSLRRTAEAKAEVPNPQQQAKVSGPRRQAETQAEMSSLKRRAEVKPEVPNPQRQAKVSGPRRRAETQAEVSSVRRTAEAKAEVPNPQQQAKVSGPRRQAETQAEMSSVRRTAEAKAEVPNPQQQAKVSGPRRQAETQAEMSSLKRRAEAKPEVPNPQRQAKVSGPRRRAETQAEMSSLRRRAEAKAEVPNPQWQAKVSGPRRQAETQAEVSSLKRRAEARAKDKLSLDATLLLKLMSSGHTMYLTSSLTTGPIKLSVSSGLVQKSKQKLKQKCPVQRGEPGFPPEKDRRGVHTTQAEGERGSEGLVVHPQKVFISRRPEMHYSSISDKKIHRSNASKSGQNTRNRAYRPTNKY